MRLEKLLLAEVIKVDSSYRIIKNPVLKQEEKRCVIPVFDVDDGIKGLHPDDPVENAKIEASRLMAEAENEANRIKKEAIDKAKEDAQSFLEELKKNTYEEAYNLGFIEGKKEGFDAGSCEGIEQGDLIRKQAKLVLEMAHKNAQEIIEKNETEIIDLSVHIAKKLLMTSLLDNHEALITIAKDACTEFRNKNQVIISVNPRIKSFFMNHVEGFKEICPNTVFTVLEDEKVNETGCIIESDTQVIDTQITSQLENVKEALLEMRTKNEG